ncbi:MAG: pilus assembly protein [Burkholderia sp.]|nr:pilus assembly protein [Burkholderia sp.]
MMVVKVTAAGVLSSLLLCGCSGLSERVDGSIKEADSQASTLVKDIGRSPSGVVAKPSPVVVHDKGIWLGRGMVKAGQPTLPPVFYEPATFDRAVSSLSELAERITLRSGIPTKVSPDALVLNTGSPSGAGAVPSTAAAPAARIPLPAGVPGGAPAPQASPNGIAAVPGGAIRLTYTKGNFKGLLDTAAARFGVSWRYASGSIQFFHTDSRTFQINAIPGDSSLVANVASGATSAGGVAGGGVGGGAGGAAAGGGVSANNSQNTGMASRLSVYTGIENSVRAMLSAHGRVVSTPATGAVTVVDTPDTLDRIAAYIDNENTSLSRQIVINVTVLSVNLADGDEYGINWDLVYAGLRNHYGLMNELPSSRDSSRFTAGILPDSGSKFAGSSLIINALSKQGKVRRHTTASVVTLNNQPVPVQVAKQTSYLQSSQTTVVAQVGTTTTLTPGTVTSGFNMSILPHVLANGTVMLQFSSDISALRELRPLESNGSRIEMPEMDTRNFLQRVAMKSNETLIISGFEQTDENLIQQGVGQPKNYLLGGGYRAGSGKEVIVVLITPSTVAGN